MVDGSAWGKVSVCTDIMPHFDSCNRVQGRRNNPIPCSNTNDINLPEIEVFEAVPRGPAPTDVLSVKNVKMYEDMNKVAHHTDKYNNSSLIVRRGQEFIMGIVFSRPFNPQNDTVNIEFMIGSNPNSLQGTLITVSLGGDSQMFNWKGRVVDTNWTETIVGITPSSDCIIGLFSTFITVITPTMKQRTKRNPKTDFYILFNPWAPSDQVYMANENERAEYVLNDTGVIYNGVIDKITSRPWNYGQFKLGVLDACLFVLDFGRMPLQFRGNAIKLVRQASGMINSQDDNGVLVGNWSGNLSLGTAPSAWTGSAEILLSYASKGGVPVKFAQCWVYAGTLNTFLRCLGVPARIITNYCSAHDNMGDLKTDIVLDEDGRMDTNYTTDSIWNFHCWNEVFLKRSDLPPIYSGWQVVDSTPQETSDGYYRCGPTSVRAVKEGMLGYQFDAPFVFAEVNSDVVFHKRDKYGNMTVIASNTTYVGQLIVTKSIGSNMAEDVTENYKYPEGSPEDKLAMEQAESRGMNRYQLALPATDVQLQLWASQINQGKDISVTIYINNLSKEQRTVQLGLTCKVDYYTGATRSIFKTFTKTLDLLPFQAKQETFTVAGVEYKALVEGKPFLSFVAYGLIKNTGISITAMSVLHLDAPPLYIEVSGASQVGADLYVTVKFTNTVGYDLNDVTLRMEGSGLMPLKTKEYSRIAPGSSVKWMESFTPQLAGKKKLVACLDCTAIRDVCGQLDVDINPENGGTD
ncbi:coagulation factor XIII, A1 polypeptide a, tandem duplicate 1 [Colossoma macropomum]|uniref:coagulation factor XIII, A1 polypeptide a, tandem duplicate 1 n=1 Tax=Colossoma macropomum TaxID=42526 RepID=UPI0018641E9B|nr:coagulation factor XIII, A1 polypeptide a, tandem duplicate 1 [Colossoma macropomum]